MADWLNRCFSGIDGAVFNFAHNLAESAGGFFTPFCRALAVAGRGGILFLTLGVVLMLFSKTRKSGFCVLVAVGVGALLTNVIIKNAVARERPYVASELYRSFWEYVGANGEKDLSFPSGHVTVVTTSMTALFLTLNKKWSWLAFLLVPIMAFSRIYLAVHYFTDVVGGIIVGGIAGVIAYFITKAIFVAIEKNSNKKFCEFMLTADILSISKKGR